MTSNLVIIFLFVFMVIATFLRKPERFVDSKNAWSMVRRYKIFNLVIALMWGAILAYQYFYLIPSFKNVYNEFGYSKEILLQFGSYLTLLFIPIVVIAGLYFYSSRMIDVEFKNNLVQHQAEEKIDTRNLFNRKIKAFSYIILFLPLIPIVFILISFFLFIARFSWQNSY